MYKKKLVTVVVSMALLTASYTVGSAYEETTVKSEQTEQVTTSKKSAEAPQQNFLKMKRKGEISCSVK